MNDTNLKDGFVAICPVSEIPATEPLTVEVDGRPIAVGRVGDKFYAIEDRCPHQGSSFDGGDIEDDILTCPLHGWRTNLITGQSLDVPSIHLKTFPVLVEGGQLYLKLE